MPGFSKLAMQQSNQIVIIWIIRMSHNEQTRHSTPNNIISAIKHDNHGTMFWGASQ